MTKYTYTRIEVQCICRACGAEFWKRKADIRAGAGQYCSKECHRRGMSGRRNPRGLLIDNKVERDMTITRVVTCERKTMKGIPRARKYELSR